MKERKVYDLFDGPKGPSCESKWYDRRSKEIWKVVAVSVKQAIYLAAQGKWYVSGGCGIVAHTEHACNENSWKYYDGSVGNTARWKHYKVFTENDEL